MTMTKCNVCGVDVPDWQIHTFVDSDGLGGREVKRACYACTPKNKRVKPSRQRVGRTFGVGTPDAPEPAGRTRA